VAAAADLVAAEEAATAAAVAVIAPAQPLEQQLFVQAAASKQQFLSNLEEIVRCSAATASRLKRAVQVAAVADVDAAATTVAAVADAADATKHPKHLQLDLQERPIRDKRFGLSFIFTYPCNP